MDLHESICNQLNQLVKMYGISCLSIVLSSLPCLGRLQTQVIKLFAEGSHFHSFKSHLKR